MKTTLIAASLLFLLSCNNEKKSDTSSGTTENNTTTTTASTTKENDPGTNTTSTVGKNTTVTLDGTELNLAGSLLVSKDKSNLHAGAKYLCMLTASGGPDNESLTVNWVMDTKPGVYPIVGLGLVRGPSENGQVFGGIAGGKPILTGNSINITEVKDLGDNGAGGHRWSISGNFAEIPIPAMKIMLMDKTKNHPTEAKINKGSFSGLVFDDNFEQLLEKITDKLNK